MFQEVCPYVGLSVTGVRLCRYSTGKAASFYVRKAAPVQDMGDGLAKAPRILVSASSCCLQALPLACDHFHHHPLSFPAPPYALGTRYKYSRDQHFHPGLY